MLFFVFICSLCVVCNKLCTDWSMMYEYVRVLFLLGIPYMYKMTVTVFTVYVVG